MVRFVSCLTLGLMLLAPRRRPWRPRVAKGLATASRTGGTDGKTFATVVKITGIGGRMCAMRGTSADGAIGAKTSATAAKIAATERRTIAIVEKIARPPALSRACSKALAPKT